MAFEVSEEIPPPHPRCARAEYWEYSTQPFNREVWGWLAIDYAENPVGFYPNGTEFPDEQLHPYIIGLGKYSQTIAISIHDKWLTDKLANIC
jgi:hypothetical protein